MRSHLALRWQGVVKAIAGIDQKKPHKSRHDSAECVFRATRSENFLTTEIRPNLFETKEARSANRGGRYGP
jgi:hypothetical protein